MKLSARNQFQGTVTKITEGPAMAEVTVKVGALHQLRGLPARAAQQQVAAGCAKRSIRRCSRS